MSNLLQTTLRQSSLVRIEPCSLRACLRILSVFLAACLTIALLDLRSATGQATDAYLLVIDNSSSMAEKGESGRPRFAEMQEHASEILSQIELGSEVRVTVFSDEVVSATLLPFDTEEERTAAIDVVTQMGNSPKGNTRLFDTLGTVFDNAETIFQGDREREVRVLVFTDGLDTSSKEWTQASLLSRFTEVVREHPNVWLFFTSINKSSSKVPDIVEHPHALRHTFTQPILLKTQPRKINLSDPIFYPEQQIELEFTGPSTELWTHLRGRPVQLSYVDNGGELTASIEMVEMQPGPIRIPIHFLRRTELSPGWSRSGKVQIVFPEIPGFEIRAANSLPVEFQMNEKPFISTKGAGEPMWNRPALLQLHNAANATSVRWLIDGTEAGARASESSKSDFQTPVLFDTVGMHTVAARITWASDHVTTVESTFAVVSQPVKASARFNCTTPDWMTWLFGSRVELIDQSEGDVLTSRWLINDRPVEVPPDGLWLLRGRSTPVKLVVTGPAPPDATPTVDSFEFVVPAAPFAQWRPYVIGIALLIVGAIWWPWLFARYPYGSRLQYCTEAYPHPVNESEESDLLQYWTARRQNAVIPLARLFLRSHYWTRGGGLREYLLIYPRGTKNSLEAEVHYSSDNSPYVVASPLFRDEHPGICFRIVDNRCDDEEYRALYFRLLAEKPRRSIVRGLGFGVLAAAGLATAAFLSWS